MLLFAWCKHRDRDLSDVVKKLDLASSLGSLGSLGDERGTHMGVNGFQLDPTMNLQVESEQKVVPVSVGVNKVKKTSCIIGESMHYFLNVPKVPRTGSLFHIALA